MSLTTAAERDSTRQRVLDVALELFATQGFAATTTRELAERLGFTKAALYYHFPTKDALLQALVEPLITQLTALVEGPGTAPGGPSGDADRASLLARYLEVIAEHRQLLGVLVQDPSAAGRPAMEAGQVFYERLMDRLAGTVAPTLADRTRVRFVLGGLHAAVLFAEPDDEPGTVRRTALAMGLAALDLPGAR